MKGISSFRDTDWYQATHALAAQVHQHQVDKGGQPYIGHLERVAERLVLRWPDATQAQIKLALLHDAIEDGQVGVADQLASEVGDEVLVSVHLVTNPRTMPYLDYIRMIAASGNADAIRVKLADNEDNSDPARAHPNAALMMERKYRPAKEILEQGLLDCDTALTTPTGAKPG